MYCGLRRGWRASLDPESVSVEEPLRLRATLVCAPLQRSPACSPPPYVHSPLGRHTFYKYPKEHWKHLRTTNPVESPFSSVRLRTDAARRYKKAENATAVIWKVLCVAEKRFRRLDAPHLLGAVFSGAKFENGELAKDSREEEAA